MASEGHLDNPSASLNYQACELSLPTGEVIRAILNYESNAYLCGTEQFPANLVMFSAEQRCLLDSAGLIKGLGAEFVADCINQAIAEGDDTEGEIEEIHPAGSIKWRLVSSSD